MSDLERIGHSADWDWRLGKIVSARRGCQQALAMDPECWHAHLQLLWFDAAFGQISFEHMERISPETHYDPAPQVADAESLATLHIETLNGAAVSP
jgi:hypothetical protein